MKKKILFLAAVVICLAILASGTAAYFTAEDTARNVITTGSVDIAVEEWQKSGNGLVPYPADPIPVMPGTCVSKIATVRNLASDAYIRAKIDIVLTTENTDAPAEFPGNLITLDMNETSWVRKENDSEWWYYVSPVAKDTATEPLFSAVTFAGSEMGNEYQNSCVEIVVTAQAVQCANNGSDALEAEGWPAETN